MPAVSMDASLTLQRDRSIVLREHNDLRATTSCFPTEVLSMIFLFVRPPIDLHTPYKDFVAWDDDDFLKRTEIFPNHVQEDYLHTLTAVCHLWRQVVTSTPQLWTTVARTVDKNSIQSVTSLLDLHFRNARNLPISIELDFCPLWNSDNPDSESLDREHQESPSLLMSLRAAVFAANRAARIRHLALLLPLAGWLSFFNKNLSQCDSVTLMQPVWSRNDEPLPASLDLAELPCLKHIELTGFNDRLSIPKGVTSLKLRRVATDVIKSLTKFTNLIDLRMIRVYGSSRLQTPIICPQLEHFGCGTGFAIYGSIREIQLPNIRSLHWYIDDDFNSDPWNGYYTHETSSTGARASRLRFFSNLPHSLSSLTVVGLPIYLEDFEIHNYLAYLPQLSELHFINLPEETLQLAIKAIGRRSSTTDSGELSGVKVLPNLRKLTLATHRNEWAYETLQESSPLMFVEMLEALHSGGGSQPDFQLIFDEFRECFHDPLICQRLRALKKEGFDIEIVLGTHTLDFSDDAAD